METELLEIEEIILLSVKEAEALPESIRACGDWWWLRTPGDDSYYTKCVYFNGSTDDVNFVGADFGGVRPALVIPELEDLDLEKYKDSVEIFGLEWIYIGDGMVLAEKPIFYSRFDEKSNDYGTSEIKQRLENWLNDIILHKN